MYEYIQKLLVESCDYQLTQFKLKDQIVSGVFALNAEGCVEM